MANVHDLVQWCNQTLKAHEFKDYAPNGLQIEGKAEVNNILSAVTASEDAIDAAIYVNADALLVHHGYFWKGEPYPITGMRGNRIKKLIQHNISISFGIDRLSACLSSTSLFLVCSALLPVM